MRKLKKIFCPKKYQNTKKNTQKNKIFTKTFNNFLI